MAMTWYDAYGQPVDTGALKTEQAAPTIVRRRHAQHPAAGLTPEQLAQILRGSVDGDPQTYLALAEDMEERDNHYAGTLAIRKRQVAGLEITVEAAGDDAKSVAAADTVREVITRDGFEDELIDILDAIGKGFSCTEIVWETSSKQWRPKRLAWRDPRDFTFDPIDGETPLLRGAGGVPEPLHAYGWIRHVAKAKSGLPIRGGLARAVAWTFLFKSFTTKDWAIFCEAYGQPLRLGKWGEGASEDDKSKLIEAVSSIGTDFAAVVPASMAIDFIKADISGSHELYERRADWLDRQTSKVVLGQTGTTDAIAGGHAVGRVHDKVRQDIEEADARQLAATLNRDLVRPVVDFEHGPQPIYPKILIRRRQEVDGVKFMATVERFVKLGGKVGMSTVRDKIGLPDPATDEELLSPPAAPATVTRPDDRSSRSGPEAFAARQPAPKRDAVDLAVDDMMSDWQPMIEPIIDGLQQKLAGVTSLAEAEQVLRQQLATMNTGELRQALARSLFAARLAGETDQDL